MIHKLTVHFTPTGDHPGLDMAAIPANRLHALLFRSVLPIYSSEQTTWLHEHPSPKPFALSPLVSPEGMLTGLCLSAWSEPAAQLLVAGWQRVYEQGETLALGAHTVQVAGVSYDKERRFEELVQATPRRQLWLRFLTPTAFRRGPLRLHLPLPSNVFDRPFQVWQTYAPPTLQLPEDWPQWCREHVMVQRHHIQTRLVPFNRQAPFVGFVGDVEFRAVAGDELYLRLWQALGKFAVYCGIGYKTTMGMGTVAQKR